MHWEVQLTGDTTDLRMLAPAFASGEVEVAQCAAEYVLWASEFKALDSAGAVGSRAIEIVSTLSGSARLALGARTSIGVGAVYRVRPDGERDITVFPEPAVIHLRALPVTVVHTRPDGTAEVQGPADAISRWLPVASKDPNIAWALRLRNVGTLDWVDLYRLYGVIEGDMGARIYELGWASRNELERFARTANSVSAAGDRARHGKERTSPPRKPMDLSAARELVDRLMRAWLEWKATREQ